MNIAITGSSQGIGRALADHFTAQGHLCLEFSRTTGHDINNSQHRQQIIAASQHCDVFINNAYHHDAQLALLQSVYHAWLGQDRRIVNISSRITDWVQNSKETSQQYYDSKLQQDQWCQGKKQWPQIINIRPGMTDTARVAHVTRSKMLTQHVVDIVEFALTAPVRITCVTFGL